MTSSNQALSYRITVFSLLALALVLVAYPILRIGYNFEIDNNEGWDAFFQLRAMQGLSLYHTGVPLFFNDYPPLSFYIVGALAKLTGDPVSAGRWISVLSLFVIAFACFDIVRSAGASKLDALFAWTVCILLFASFGTDYVGINDPHLLGQALFLLCLAAYFRLPPSIPTALILGLMFTVGVLTKHNMLVVPLLVTVDVLKRWPMKAKLAYVGWGVVLAGAVGAFFWFVVGKAFFQQSSLYDPARGFLMSVDMLFGHLQSALAVVGLILIIARKERPYGLIGAYLLLTLIQGSLFTAGDSNDVNHFFDMFSALAVGSGLAVHWIKQQTDRPYAPMILALAINAGLILYSPLAMGRFVVDMMGDMAERERLFEADVAYVKQAKGQVLCQSFLLCYRAGLPMFFDPHNVRMGQAHGDYPPDLLIGMLKRHEIKLMQVEDRRQHLHDEYPGRQAMPAMFIHFDDDVFDELEADYKVARVGYMGLFWVPKETP